MDLRETDGLPLVLEPRGSASPADLFDLFERRRREIDERLLDVGAVLFRGFHVEGALAFQALARSLGEQASLGYVGGDSPRTLVARDVYTSTECPPTVAIPLHNEMSYLPRYPRRIWFHCARAATLGGATPLADARKVLASLPRTLVRRFDDRGVAYHCRYARARSRICRSWRDAFDTEARASVEARCRELDLVHEWQPSGGLITRGVRPATARHPSTGQRLWFNQAHLFRLSARAIGRVHYALSRLVGNTHHATYGDAREIEAESIEAIFDAIDAHTRSVPWQAGDVLLVDNLLCMHGRQPFFGPRKILVTMTA